MAPAAYTDMLHSLSHLTPTTAQPSNRVSLPLQQVTVSKYSPPCLLSSASPVKSKPRRVEGAPVQAHTFPIALLPPNPQHPSAIDVFPTSDHPISEQTMKSMLISLRQTLYTDLSATVSSLANVVQQHDQHLQHVKSKMSELFTAHNDLIDMCTEHGDDMQLVKVKLADLEDRSYRNNIKFCNVPESVQQP